MENYTVERVKSANSLQDLIGGLIFVSVERKKNEESILFKTADGWEFELYHEQDCCEKVWLEDINGDLSDLVGTPIVVAEKRSNTIPSNVSSEDDDDDESPTWTFFCFRTIKGSVDIAWCGTSNGCYRVDADMRVFHPEKFRISFMPHLDS